MISVLWGIIVSAEAMYFSDHRALHVAFPRDDFLGFRPPPGLEGQAGPRLADEIRENRTVHVPMCYGRMGNHLYQFARLAFFAEVMNATALFPRRNSCIMDMFAFPERLEVLRSDPEFLSRVHCDVDGSWDGVHCTGQKRSDYVRVFRQYVLPYLVQEGQEVCDVEAGNTRRELTIHMRSGDLLIHTDHPQSRFAPCVFFEKVAHDFNFTRLRIITEPDMAHPCIGALQRSQSPFDVTVQSKSKVEDACALMYAKHLALGSISTFSIMLSRFNPNPGFVYGSFGSCSTENTTEIAELSCGATRQVEYCVDGILDYRLGEDKKRWLVNYGSSSIRKTQESCNTDPLAF
mmetsp:Transcript_51806/g.138217  ORF Transcript_51806/g.138217 Transcript_51806/m.138217 type:complete len:347 (-) Transcript_51806:170-1210(-)